MTSKLLLTFTDGLELESAVFQHPLLKRPRAAYRSNRVFSCKPHCDTSTIQWSSAVKALCILLLRNLGSTDLNFSLCGARGSAASSLDFALGKEPEWMKDLFGTDSTGKSLALRLFLRLNPEGKKSGPFIVRVNDAALPKQNIAIIVNKKQIKEPSCLRNYAMKIENESWSSDNQSLDINPLDRSIEMFGSLESGWNT